MIKSFQLKQKWKCESNHKNMFDKWLGCPIPRDWANKFNSLMGTQQKKKCAGRGSKHSLQAAATKTTRAAARGEMWIYYLGLITLANINYAMHGKELKMPYENVNKVLSNDKLEFNVTLMLSNQ